MKPKAKVISWNLCQACNYNCSYCAQGKKHEGFPPVETVKKAVEFFCALGSGWEIKISGGEPFLYPGFLEIVRSLQKAGLLISVVTNFSFSKRLYKKFFKVCAENLRSFSVSLHREKVDRREFLKKCLWAKKKIEKTARGSLVVNSVVEPGRAAELVEIKTAFKNRGIRFYPQLKRKKGRPVEYDAAEQAVILELAEDRNPFTINAGYRMKNRICYAGINYFVVTPGGECFTCYPGKRDRSGYMGSFPAGDFVFRGEPMACPYEVCPCTVPINRGMIRENA